MRIQSAGCVRAGLVGLFAWLFLTTTVTEARAAEQSGSDHVYLQLGVGVIEVLNASVGYFVTPRLTMDLWIVEPLLLAAHGGGGVTYALLGADNGGRAPHHALTIGARLMFDRDLSFDSHGEDIASYLALPVGYAYRSPGSILVRASIAAIADRRRTDAGSGHEIGLSGMLFNLSGGWAF
jgi:hypothetical protein